MERIKNIEDIIISEFDVLLEIIEQTTESGIISPNGKDLGKDSVLAYGVVRAIGSKVEDIDKGDIIVKTRIQDVPGWEVGDKSYTLISRHQILVAVKPANFDANDELTA